MRLDTWSRRGFAAVDNAAAQAEYAAWLETYVANWRTYVAETCPHVTPNIRNELDSRLGLTLTDSSLAFRSSLRRIPHLTPSSTFVSCV